MSRIGNHSAADKSSPRESDQSSHHGGSLKKTAGDSKDSSSSADAGGTDDPADTGDTGGTGTSTDTGSTTSSSGGDFSAVLDAYNEMQKNAYTNQGTHHQGQSVTDDEVSALKDALDSYIEANVSGSSKSSMLQAVSEQCGALTEMVDAPEHGTQSSNAMWDQIRGEFESFLAEVSPSDASQIWTPGSGGGGGGTGGDTSVSGVSGINDIALPNNGSSDSESGTGWGGDVNKAATSKTYKGKSLEEMLADKSTIVAQEIGNQPDLVAAIKQVSAKYNIPDGLLAATIIQESNGNRDCKTYNSGYEGSAPGDQCYDVGVIQSPLFMFPGSTTAEKLKNSEDPVQNLELFAKEASGDYQKYGSWGMVLRSWNSGGVGNPNDLSQLNGYGVSSYVSNILGHIALGSGDYG